MQQFAHHFTTACVRVQQPNQRSKTNQDIIGNERTSCGNSMNNNTKLKSHNSCSLSKCA